MKQTPSLLYYNLNSRLTSCLSPEIWMLLHLRQIGTYPVRKDLFSLPWFPSLMYSLFQVCVTPIKLEKEELEKIFCFRTFPYRILHEILHFYRESCNRLSLAKPWISSPSLRRKLLRIFCSYFLRSSCNRFSTAFLSFWSNEIQNHFLCWPLRSVFLQIRFVSVLFVVYTYFCYFSELCPAIIFSP